MTGNGRLSAISPTALGAARAQVHRAVQYPTLAARANLAPAADDSHSNLGWDETAGAFVSHPLPVRSGDLFVSVSVAPMVLSVAGGNQAPDALDLADKSTRDVDVWFEEALTRTGLTSVSGTSLPYELPADVEAVSHFAPGNSLADELSTLAAWYDLAHRSLTDFAAKVTDVSPGPGAVRCWPHHFDIATYVGLESGDFETARGIGVGLSPGDESYAQPYFYINPWPHLPTDGLPDLPPPGHWHTEGFVGAIATGEEVLSLPDIDQGIGIFIANAFELGRNRLGM